MHNSIQKILRLFCLTFDLIDSTDNIGLSWQHERVNFCYGDVTFYVVFDYTIKLWRMLRY